MRARLWEDPQGALHHWVTGVGLKVRLRVSDFIHTPPHCVCGGWGGGGVQTVVLSAGWGFGWSPRPCPGLPTRLGSHMLPAVPQHLRGREQKVPLTGLAVVRPLQSRCLLLGLRGGFLNP